MSDVPDHEQQFDDAALVLGACPVVRVPEFRLQLWRAMLQHEVIPSRVILCPTFLVDIVPLLLVEELVYS